MKKFYLAIIAFMSLLSLIVPFFMHDQITAIHLDNANLPPSLTYLFGTDDLGRDLFARIWFGVRISLFVGIAAAALDLAIGIAWGGAAALAGGHFDNVLMSLADILNSIPSVMIAILLTLVFGTSMFSIIFCIALVGWIPMARVVRGQIAQLKQQEFVTAAKLYGAGFWRILFLHLIPNAFPAILVTLTLTIPSAIFTEAFLSFMGLGIQMPLASLGSLTAESIGAMAYYPWRLFIPGGLLTLLLLSLNEILPESAVSEEATFS
jgi:oligopeptide transport system permease protein